MRQTIITLFFLLSIGVSWAGERNSTITLGVRNFTDTPKRGEKDRRKAHWGTIASMVITGQNTTQQPQYKDAVRAAIVKGLASRFRTVATDMESVGDKANGEFDYYVDATINIISPRQPRPSR